MEEIERLQNQWRDNARFRGIHAGLSLEKDGLALGAKTILAKRDSAGALAIDGEEAKLLTLLAVAYGRPVDLSVLRNIRVASKHARAGNECMAAMHIALAGLPKLPDPPDDARRLFIADGLIAEGVAPRDIWTALEFDSAPLDELEKYSPTEPRNPAGSGRISGEWVRDLETILEEAAEPVVDTFEVSAAGVAAVAAAALLASTSPAMPPFVEGTIPGRPDLRYGWSADEFSLLIYRGADPNPVREARLGPKSTLVDKRGRKVGYLTATGIDFDLKGLPPEWPSLEEQKDDPQPCPKPRPDRGGLGVMGGVARDYEDFRKAQINVPPTPRGFAYWFENPVDGRYVVIDDCQRQTGGIFEYKGNYKGFMATAWGRKILGIDWRYQATRQWEASEGRPMEWDFADKEAADYARELFREDEWLRSIDVEWKPWIRSKMNKNESVGISFRPLVELLDRS